MMSSVRSCDTRPEVVIRKSLHARGFRYRLHAPELPDKPDIVFRKHRAVLLVHGCFSRPRLPPVPAARHPPGLLGGQSRPQPRAGRPGTRCAAQARLAMPDRVGMCHAGSRQARPRRARGRHRRRPRFGGPRSGGFRLRRLDGRVLATRHRVVREAPVGQRHAGEPRPLGRSLHPPRSAVRGSAGSGPPRPAQSGHALPASDRLPRPRAKDGPGLCTGRSGTTTGCAAARATRRA